jgi:hypothetical protein
MRFLVFLAAPQVPFWQDGRFSLALTGMLLAGVLLLGAMVVAWVGRAFKDDRKRGISSPEDQLSEFRTMLEAGELTPQEFEIVKRKLGRKISNKEPATSETPAGLTPSIPDSPSKEPPEGDTPRAFPPNNDDIAKS